MHCPFVHRVFVSFASQKPVFLSSHIRSLIHIMASDIPVNEDLFDVLARLTNEDNSQTDIEVDLTKDDTVLNQNNDKGLDISQLPLDPIENKRISMQSVKRSKE